ncbi:MAG: hypothetical protein IKQ97_08580 [Eubacterium sp.]|nr:hypothetical protein [Eubacterium sp.]
MLSENRIKKMIRLSDYETGIGEVDLRRTRYRRRDFVRIQVLRTVAGMIAASILILGLVALYFIDRIPWSLYVSEGFFTFERVLYLVGGLVLWLILLGIAVAVTGKRSRREYDESELRVNEYEQTLAELLQLYENERKGETT